MTLDHSRTIESYISTFSDINKMYEFFSNLGIELGFHVYLSKDYPSLRTHICNRTIEERNAFINECPIIVVLYDWGSWTHEIKKQSIRCNLINFNEVGDLQAVLFNGKETVQDLIDFLLSSQEKIKTIQIEKKKNEIDTDFL